MEDNIIKDIRNLFELKRKIKKRKEIYYTTIKDIRNIFILKKENEGINARIIRDTRNLFEHEENYSKPIRVANFWNNNYTKYESNGNRNTIPSTEKYLNKFRRYHTPKIQITIAINLIPSKDNDQDYL